VKLGPRSEVQPDVLMRMRDEYGGDSRITPEGYVAGAPELVAEVAHSSRAIDLGSKYEEYARHGVLEYLVPAIEDQQLHWFDLPNNRELPVPDDGIVRSISFPGLWIDTGGLFANDPSRTLAALEKGLASPEHAEFIARLEERRRQESK
jgi:hypothetical protein